MLLKMGLGPPKLNFTTGGEKQRPHRSGKCGKCARYLQDGTGNGSVAIAPTFVVAKSRAQEERDAILQLCDESAVLMNGGTQRAF